LPFVARTAKESDPAASAPESSSGPRSGADAQRTAGLLRDWYDLVWRVLLRFGVPAANAEDAAQEVFLIASNKLEQIAPVAERQFLYAIAVRVAANFRRVLGTRREVPLEPLEWELAAGSQPDLLLEQKRARELLERVLDSMPEDLRTAFVLFELEELRGPEVAEVLGVPLGTTASRLRRAREHFKTALARVRKSPRGGLR
jgi:RNA polymerase sigma-70 factor (ECF subfamily)